MAEGLALLADDLKKLAADIRGLEGHVLPAVAFEMQSVVKRNLLASVDADGGPLLPLKDGSGRRPLLKTLALYNAVRGFVNGKAAVVECKVEYAGIQNQGGTISKPERRRVKGEKPWVFQGADGRTIFTRRIRAHSITIPARQVAGIGRSMVDGVVGVILRFLQVRAKGLIEGSK
jgi:phage gpG-like protein